MLQHPFFKTGIFLFLVFMISCSNHKDRKVARGFYYWKTNVNVSDYERETMNDLSSEYLYTRFFDVTVASDGKSVQPSAIANFAHPLPKQKIIPVVFITRKALNHMARNKLDFYARNMAKLLKQKAASIHLNPEEIQIDCDWTPKNKALYFALLRKLKSQPYLKHKILSATIRLYQVKFPQKTGVPPVDKGVLMVYNIGDLTNYYTDNSILEVETAKKYLDNIATYSLPLDVALPIFSWTLLFQGTSLNGILRAVNEHDLKKQSFFEKQKGNRYLVLKDTLYKGYRLKKGEHIRYEKSTFKSVDKISQYLSAKMKKDALTILLYDCDRSNFKKFSKDEMEEIFSDFN